MPFPAFFLLAAALGAREGIANRREKGRLLDLEADRQDAINNIDIGISAMGASNQFDAAQIEAMQKQSHTAQGMLRSKDPKQQAMGANILQGLSTAVRGNIQQNETEARADAVRQQDLDIAATGIGLEANEKRFERELKMNTQLNTELQPVLDAQVSYSKVNNLLDNDDQVSTLAGLTAFVQSIDDSVVREGELLKYTGANGLVIQFVNAVNKAEGRDFDVTTKQSIRNASAALMNAEKSRGIALTNSYQDRAVSFGLSPERVLSGVDENLFTPIQIDRSAQEAAQAQADAVEDAQLQEVDQGAVAGVISTIIGGGQDILGGIGRNLRGAKLLRTDNGDLFEEAADGTRTKIGREDQFTDDQGRTLRLVDRGGGRFDWVVVDAGQSFLGELLSPEASERRREEDRQRGILR